MVLPCVSLIRENSFRCKHNIATYSFIRCHSSISNIPSTKVYYSKMLLDYTELAA
jgi:hypothetical protein